MNWRYLGTEAILPLVIALGTAMAAGLLIAIRLHRQGGSSLLALRRLLLMVLVVFPLAFFLAAIWEARHTVRGMAGLAMGRAKDQRAMGLLRSHGEGFLRKDPTKAVAWFQRAAERGDADSQLFMARALLNGRDLPRDAGAALRWASAAADQGQSDAMVLVGDLLISSDPKVAGSRYRQALSIFSEQARKGDARSCLSYGLMHTDGKGVVKDPVEGLAWMLTARQLGLDPFTGILVQLNEVTLTSPQRAEAAQRAKTIQQQIPPRQPAPLTQS